MIECGYSDLHAILRSGLHCWWQNRALNPEYRPSQSAAMDGGSVAHKLLLGKGREIAELDFKDFKTNAAKEARAAAYAAGQLPILASKLPPIRKMAEIALAYVTASELPQVFESGIAEETIRWQESGTLCRATPDWLNAEAKILLDYKSTAGSAAPESFVRQIVAMGYDLQAVHYQRAAPGHIYVWLVQENEAPFACSLCSMSPQMQEIAERKWDYAMTLWKHALQTNEWRGYPSRIAFLEPPAWEIARVEEMVDRALELGEQA